MAQNKAQHGRKNIYMKKIHTRLGRFAVMAGLALSAGSASATPMTYSIYQPGWSFSPYVWGIGSTPWYAGGIVSGLFEGEDLNHDGHIEFAAGEVTRYEISYSGNSFIPAFTHTLNDLLYLDYTLGSGGFRPSILYSFGSGYIYDADDHILGLPDLSVVSTTASDATVSPVPAPATPFLVLSGLLLMLLRSRRSSLPSASRPHPFNVENAAAMAPLCSALR